MPSFNLCSFGLIIYFIYASEKVTHNNSLLFPFECLNSLYVNRMSLKSGLYQQSPTGGLWTTEKSGHYLKFLYFNNNKTK